MQNMLHHAAIRTPGKAREGSRV